MVEPSLDFPRWSLLVLPALIAGLASLATSLSDGRWIRFVVASALGTFAGLCGGFVVFPSSDPIADSYAPFAVVVGTILSALAALLAGLVSRQFGVLKDNRRRCVWLALTGCVAFGPTVLALTPTLVAYRVARNDRAASKRLKSLQDAVVQTIAATGDRGRICDGQGIKQHDSGPPFSEEDWQRIERNYVKQAGYVFMIYCREQGGYTIHATRGDRKVMEPASCAATRRAESGTAWNGIVHDTLAFPAGNRSDTYIVRPMRSSLAN